MLLSERRINTRENNIYNSKERANQNTYLGSIPINTLSGKKSTLVLSSRKPTIGGHLHPLAPKLHLDLLGTPSSMANPTRSLDRQTQVMGRIKQSLRAINNELDVRSRSERKLADIGVSSARGNNGQYYVRQDGADDGQFEMLKVKYLKKSNKFVLQNQRVGRSFKKTGVNKYNENNSSLLRKENGFEQRYQAERNHLGDTA